VKPVTAGAAAGAAFVALVALSVTAAADTAPLPDRLVETGLYRNGGTGELDPRVRAFSPQYPLWSDGLTKRRWIHLPAGTAIDGRDEHAWIFPVGTKLWKEFSLNGRRVETRLLWKASPAGWTFASYQWNGAGTEAVLAPAEGVRGVAEVGGGRRHSIPSRMDCAACHGTRGEAPLGFTPLQLSEDRDPNAIHGEPPLPGMLTLGVLVDGGLLVPSHDDPAVRAPRIRAASPLTRSVLGYLVGNCAMCHNGRGEIAALGPVLRPRDLTTDGEGVARGLIGQPTKWQVPGAADGRSVLIDPDDPALSAILVRMRSRSPSSQMPPLGTVVRDQEAVGAVERWIAEARATQRVRPASR
jgi:hypothetical protein